MLERISKITERWFLSEEALFSVFCTHRVAENSGMECHVRVGKGVIEVNPDLCADITDKELEERLRIEVIRILLKHMTVSLMAVVSQREPWEAIVLLVIPTAFRR